MKTFRIVNQTRDTIVARRVRLLHTPWSRFFGLMGRKTLPDGQGVLIDPCSSIHTMFMRFPIDAVFLDGDGRVTKAAVGVRPWRAVLGGGGKKVLELREGAAAEAQIREGDLLVRVED
jgi:uncharacterized membrane protein (UPF0127 family)